MIEILLVRLHFNQNNRCYTIKLLAKLQKIFLFAINERVLFIHELSTFTALFTI